MIQDLVKLAGEKKIAFNQEGFNKDREYISLALKAELAQIFWNNRDYFYQVRAHGDNQIQEAAKLFDQARLIAGFKSAK